MALPIAMHQPPRPGEFITGVYLEPCALSLRQVAERLGVSASTFQRLVTSKSRVTPDMALRLSALLGRSPVPAGTSHSRLVTPVTDRHGHDRRYAIDRPVSAASSAGCCHQGQRQGQPRHDLPRWDQLEQPQFSSRQRLDLPLLVAAAGAAGGGE